MIYIWMYLYIYFCLIYVYMTFDLNMNCIKSLIHLWYTYIYKPFYHILST